MRRVQAGDEAALAALMEEWELPVKRLVARLVPNVTEAEELAQEAFVRVWQQRQRFRLGAEFRPWLFAIAINLARNRLRWWRRRPVVSLEAWMGTDGGGRKTEDGGPRTEDRGPRTEDGGQRTDGGGRRTDGERRAEGEGQPGWELERRERAEAVQRAVAALPAELREALVLSEYEELSHAEAAAALGCTAKAVETRLYRARAQLRKALQGLVG